MANNLTKEQIKEAKEIRQNLSETINKIDELLDGKITLDEYNDYVMEHNLIVRNNRRKYRTEYIQDYAKVSITSTTPIGNLLSYVFDNAKLKYQVFDEDTIEFVYDILNYYLTEREATMIKSRYGIDTEQMSRKEIAQQNNISESRVGYLLRKSCRKIISAISRGYTIRDIRCDDDLANLELLKGKRFCLCRNGVYNISQLSKLSLDELTEFSGIDIETLTKIASACLFKFNIKLKEGEQIKYGTIDMSNKTIELLEA